MSNLFFLRLVAINPRSATANNVIAIIVNLPAQTVALGSAALRSGQTSTIIIYKVTYVEVILAQTNKLQAELDLASLKTQRLNAITTLYRSVGGGWQ